MAFIVLDEARARAAGCRAVGAVGVGAFDRSVTKPHINQGKQIMPTPLILAPLLCIFRPSYGPAAGKISLRVTMNMR